MTRTKSVKALLCVLLSMTLIIAFMPQTANVYAASAKKATSITKITSKDSSYTLGVGQSRKLTVRVNPKNLTSSAKTVYVSSSNKSVAKPYAKTYVKKNGYYYCKLKVKGMAKGTATITAKTKTGKKATWKITVKAAPVAVKTVAISNYSTGNDSKIAVGDILKATVTPANAAVTYQWYSVDPTTKVATAIAGATEQTYKVMDSAVVGQYIKVVAKSATASAEATTTAKTEAGSLTGIAINLPTGHAVPAVGDVLTTTTTPAATDATYQWYRDGLAIAGATSSSYTVTLADNNTVLSVRAYGTKTFPAAAPGYVTNQTPLGKVTAPLNATMALDKATAAQGETITPTITDNAVTPATELAGATVNYTWYKDSVATANVIQAKSTTAAYTVAKDLEGKTLICVAEVTGKYSGSVQATAKVISKIVTAVVSDTAPTVGQKIKVNTTTASGKAATATYQWYRGVNAISGANAAEYTVAAADIDYALTCKVTGTGDYAGSVIDTAATTAVDKSAISAVEVTNVAGDSPSAGDTLKATMYDGSTPANEITPVAGDVTYQWYKTSVSTANKITGATSATYTPATTEAGSTFFCEITATTQGADSFTGLAKNGSAKLAAKINSVTLKLSATTDTYTVGKTITASTDPAEAGAAVDAGASAAGATYTWYKDSVATANMIGTGKKLVNTTGTPSTEESTTANQLVLTDAMVGHTIICVVKSSIDKYAGATATSVATAKVTGNISTVTLDSGSATTGQKLSITSVKDSNNAEIKSFKAGTATTAEDTTFDNWTVQWYSDGNAIAGATGKTYTTVGSDIGKVITCKVTGIGNYAGTTAQDVTTAVTAGGIALSVASSNANSEVAAVGNTLTVSLKVSGVASTDAAKYVSYQWYKMDTAGVALPAVDSTTGATAIAGATNATYTVQSGDAGYGVFCVVTLKTGATEYTLATPLDRLGFEYSNVIL